jgi:hypothetical protein
VKIAIKYKHRWQSVAAFTCFAISTLSLGIGFIFTTGFILDADRHPMLHGVGLTLLIIGIPILILGGHFLDLMGRKRQSSKDIQEQ